MWIELSQGYNYLHRSAYSKDWCAPPASLQVKGLAITPPPNTVLESMGKINLIRKSTSENRRAPLISTTVLTLLNQCDLEYTMSFTSMPEHQPES